MNIKMLKAASIGVVLSVSGFANAGLVTWDLQNSFFDDGTAIIGSFDFEADTGSYSNVNISVEQRGVFPKFTYSDPNIFIGQNSAEDVDFVKTDFSSYLHLSFDSELTNFGGSKNLQGSFECNNCFKRRTIFNGLIVAQTEVPEPSTLMIFALGFMGFAFKRFNTH